MWETCMHFLAPWLDLPYKNINIGYRLALEFRSLNRFDSFAEYLKDEISPNGKSQVFFFFYSKINNGVIFLKSSLRNNKLSFQKSWYRQHLRKHSVFRFKEIPQQMSYTSKGVFMMTVTEGKWSWQERKMKLNSPEFSWRKSWRIFFFVFCFMLGLAAEKKKNTGQQ